MNLSTLTIAQARKDLDAKKYTAVELAEEYLRAIKEKNEEIKAYLEVFDDVREQAKKADEMIKEGEAKVLTGIPFAIKDNILIKGRRASAASKILENYVATYDATVIEKLKAEGVVFLGRTNMDEFAMGSSTENSAFMQTKNPRDTERVPGGSSGGSAAAVAGNLALAALGSDTGGSVRQPASLCGVVGVKSTYGTVSRFGLIAMGSSLDQIGVFSKTVEDAEMVLSVISGYDPNDSTSLPEDFYSPEDADAKTIGVPRSFMKKGIDPDVLEEFEKTLSALEKEGYKVKDIELPNLDYALATYYIIMPAESSTNLTRFDGIRYGLRIEGHDIHDGYKKTRGAGFGPEVRRRILLGTFVLSAGYADAYYRKATAVREVLRGDFDKAFKDVDIVATPASPTPAFKIGEKSSDPLEMYAADIFTVPVNLTGGAAMSVPTSTVERDGKKLPSGFHLIAPHGEEGRLFRVAADAERTVE